MWVDQTAKARHFGHAATFCGTAARARHPTPASPVSCAPSGSSIICHLQPDPMSSAKYLNFFALQIALGGSRQDEFVADRLVDLKIE